MRTLDAVAREASDCTKCALSATRTSVVFSSGDPAADLMFVGEAPGFHEDRRGVPFVGAAGGLLDELLGELGMRRDDVYVANVLKCRPPNNRDPLAEEIASCHPYLLEQIDCVDPLVVCTLGNFATKLLLETTIAISRLRGKRYRYRDRLLIPTFHPAAALHSGGRTSPTMASMREDFALIAASLARARAERAAPVSLDGVSQPELF